MEEQSDLVQEALTKAVSDIAICDVPESLVQEMGEAEYVRHRIILTSSRAC